jgi:hypothetical protein
VTLEPGVNHVTIEWKIPDDAPYGEYERDIVVYYNEKVCSHIHTYYGGIVIASPSKPDWVREGLYFILLWKLLEYQPGEPEEKVAELKKEIELEVKPFYERGSINITKVSEKWVVMSMQSVENLEQNMTWFEFNHILTMFLGIVDPRYLAELKLPVEQLMIGGKIYVAYKLENKTEDSIILTYFDKDSGIALLLISGGKVSTGFDYFVLALLDSNLKELAPVSTLQMLPNQANYIVNSSKAGELGEIVFEPPISDLQGLKKVNIVLDKPLATNTSIVVNLPSLIENNVVKQNVLLNLTDQSLRASLTIKLPSNLAINASTSVSNLTIRYASLPREPESWVRVLPIYDLGPSKLSFNPGITLSFIYSDDLIKSRGLNESQLTILYYDENSGKWISVDTIVDTVNNIASANITHFTIFTLATPATKTTTILETHTLLIVVVIVAIIIVLIPFLLKKRRM